MDITTEGSLNAEKPWYIMFYCCLPLRCLVDCDWKDDWKYVVSENLSNPVSTVSSTLGCTPVIIYHMCEKKNYLFILLKGYVLKNSPALAAILISDPHEKMKLLWKTIQWLFMYILGLIKFVIFEKKCWIYFSIGSYVKSCDILWR